MCIRDSRDTHNALQQAHDTLSKDTTDAEAELKTLQTRIKNASAVCNIPASSILAGCLLYTSRCV